MNRDKIRESINTLFSWACDTTDGTGIEQEVHKAYQSAISGLQSDVAVMRKITGEEKWDANKPYFIACKVNGFGAKVFWNPVRKEFQDWVHPERYHPVNSVTHYLQIELED